MIDLQETVFRDVSKEYSKYYFLPELYLRMQLCWTKSKKHYVNDGRFQLWTDQYRKMFHFILDTEDWGGSILFKGKIDTETIRHLLHRIHLMNFNAIGESLYNAELEVFLTKKRRKR